MTDKGKPEMRWEVPPASRNGYRWDAIAAKAKTRPGKWLRVQGPIQSAYGARIRKGSPKIFGPAGSFDAVIRNSSMDNGSYGDLYIRYLGEEESNA